MSQCALIDIEGAHPQIPTQFDGDTGNAIPVSNVLTVNGLVNPNAIFTKPLWVSGSGSTLTINMQVAAAITGAPADSNDAGIASFNDTQFSVDSNGYVSLVGGGGATLNTLTGDDAAAVSADGAGNIDLLGTAVANATYAKPFYVDGDAGSNALNFSIQVASAVAATPTDKNDAGICSFDQSTFSVNTDGFVTLLSGPGISSNTGDDSVAVFPTGAGDFGWLGQTVANATHAKPVYFKDSATANSLDLDVQVAAAITGAPADANDAGLASFDDTQFTVDTNGYVALVGAANLPSIQTITSDDPTVVGPDGSGNIDFTGEAVANATNAKPVFVDAGTNALNVEVQVAVDRTGAPANSNDAGLASFDDTEFTVDANGFVQLLSTAVGQTITGDSGGALSPTAGNWNILGGPGVTTSGSGSTLTINSVVYTDEGISASVTSDSGSFSTAAITLTLPASPANGERCEFIASTADQLVITAAGTQVINVGSTASSAGGTLTSNAKGDAVSLIYQSSSDDWFALSVVGVWTAA